MEETITPAIRICDVRKRYGQHEVLQGIDMEVMPKEVVCLIGPSGSGKSTILRCVNFLEVYDEGEILVEGALMGYEVQYNGTRRRASETRIRESRRDLGMVFQHFNLWPHMTVMENVTEALISVAGKSRAAAEKKGLECLERVGLAEKCSSYPAQLSGGQQQRVAIARALATEPRIMFATSARRSTVRFLPRFPSIQRTRGANLPALTCAARAELYWLWLPGRRRYKSNTRATSIASLSP